MVLFEDAIKTVLSQTFTIEHERVSIADSLGRVLSEDIFSDMDMPPFDKSAVDGYAVKTADFDSAGTVTLGMVETIAAGNKPLKTIMAGECSKIMTGAMVPEGADCVIMVEETEITEKNQVIITRRNSANNICYQGEDIRLGDLVLPKGVRITPAHIAVMAAVGAVNPLVVKLPKVGIISTGDELVEPNELPGIAQIRNSNAIQLESQVRTVPSQPVYYGIAADAGPELYKIINEAMENCDLVLLTGGVSMGDFDFVPDVMQEAGIEILFNTVAIQPGKPTVFGRRDNRFIFGLPGNPVSSYVLFEMMVRPFLLRMMGCSLEPVELKLPLGVDFSRRKSTRKSMIPVMIRDGAAFPVEYHGSAHINAYTIADGIMMMDIGSTTFTKGELVYVRPI